VTGQRGAGSAAEWVAIDDPGPRSPCVAADAVSPWPRSSCGCCCVATVIGVEDPDEGAAFGNVGTTAPEDDPLTPVPLTAVVRWAREATLASVLL